MIDSATRHAQGVNCWVWFLAVFLWVGPAGKLLWAHGLHAYYQIWEDKIEVVGKYDSGVWAQNAKVVVKCADESVLHQGRTDAQGTFTFPRPKPGIYSVIVDGGQGHLGRTTINLRDETSTTARKARVHSRFGPDASWWLKVGIGLAVIGGLALALTFAVRYKKPEPHHDST